MRITLAHIGARTNAKDGFENLTASYLDRCTSFAKFSAQVFRSEEAFFDWLGRQHARLPAFPVLLDGRGGQLSSEEFALWMGERRAQGVQHLVFAIGPADGWSDSARAKAQLLLSLGKLTLPHALARLVIAEQIYRAFTILYGHPYHSGH